MSELMPLSNLTRKDRETQGDLPVTQSMAMEPVRRITWENPASWPELEALRGVPEAIFEPTTRGILARAGDLDLLRELTSLKPQP